MKYLTLGACPVIKVEIQTNPSMPVCDLSRLAISKITSSPDNSSARGGSEGIRVISSIFMVSYLARNGTSNLLSHTHDRGDPRVFPCAVNHTANHTATRHIRSAIGESLIAGAPDQGLKPQRIGRGR